MTTPRARIERLRSANADAAELATLCALAVLVEPELLRRLRLLLPGADVTAESDLWASDLLSGASPRGIALDPVIADELRANLRTSHWDSLRDNAWRHIADSHRALHWSLRLEEQINRHVVDGVGVDRIERLLLAAVGELVTRDAGTSVQIGIARWLLGALARLPRLATTTDAASAAGLAAGLHLDGRVPITNPGRVDEHWLPWLLATAGAPSTRVPVRFADGKLAVNATGTDTVAIDVPRTEPMVLDLDWHDGRSAQSARLTFTESSPATCPVVGDDVTLTTLAGQRTRLRLNRTTSGGLDFTAERARHRPCLGMYSDLERVAKAVRAVPWTIFTGDEGTGKTVLACALADRLERRGWAVVQHFYGVEPAWDDPAVVAASLEAQLRAAFPDVDWSRPVAGQPGGLWGALERVGNATTGRQVLVLIDGIPTTSTEDTTRWMFASSSLPSKARGGVRFLVTGRYAAGVADWLKPEDQRSVHDVSDRSGKVCLAMLDYENSGLRAAFGTDPNDTELLSLAGGNPGRLAGIIDWLLSRPPFTATVESIPRSLTVRMGEAWRELIDPFSETAVDWLAAVAVGTDGFTIDDTQQIGAAPWHSQLLDEALRSGLLTLDGPREDGASLLRAEPSWLNAFVARYGPEVLGAGHAMHARALDLNDLASMSRYQISAAVYHFIRSVGQADAPPRSDLTKLCRSGEFLRRRACQDGVDSVLADLRTVGDEVAPILHAAESIAEIAARHPDRFVELLIGALHRRGIPVNDELVDGWPPALIPQWVRRFRGESLRSRITQPTVAAASGPGADWFALAGMELTIYELTGRPLHKVNFSNELTAVVGHESDVAVANADGVLVVSVVTGQVSHRWTTTSPVTVLESFEGTLVAGSRSGVIALIQDGTVRPVVGHGGSVTALAQLRGLFVSASVDGTVRIWDLATGAPLRTVHHRAPVRHIVENGKEVVSADDTGRVRWWDSVSGKEIRTLRGHDAPVTALHLIDEQTAISAAADGTMWRWHRNDPAQDLLFTDSGPAVRGARYVWVPESPTVFLTWDDAGQVAWWDRDGAQRAVRKPDDMQLPIRTVLFNRGDEIQIVHAGGVVTVPTPPRRDNPTEQRESGALAVLNHDNVALATSSGVVVHDVDRNRWISDTESRPVVGLAAMSGGSVLAVRPDGTAHIWHDHRPAIPRDDLPPVHLIAAGGRRLVVCDENGNLFGVDSDRSLTESMWPLALPGATALAVGPEGSDDLVVGDAHGRVVVFNGSDVRAPAPITALAAGAQWRVVGTSDGSVFRWWPAGSLTLLGRHDGPVEGLVVLGKRFAASTSMDGTVRLWDVSSGVEHAIVAGPEPFHGVAFGEQHQLFARAGADGLWLLELRTDFTQDGMLTIRPAAPVEMRRAERPFVRQELSCHVPFEIRAVRLVAGGWNIGSEVRVSFDQLGRFGESVDVDGRLAVPRRGGPEQVLPIWVSYEPDPNISGLRIIYATPGRRDERWVAVPIPEMEEQT